MAGKINNCKAPVFFLNNPVFYTYNYFHPGYKTILPAAWRNSLYYYNHFLLLLLSVTRLGYLLFSYLALPVMTLAHDIFMTISLSFVIVISLILFCLRQHIP